MTVLLDASAALALLLDEPGSEKVAAVIQGAVISSVNMSEIYAKSVDLAKDVEATRKFFRSLPVRIVGFDDAHAFVAGQLRQQTRQYGLSFGDRACLATAMIEKRPVMTADKAWRNLDLDIEIMLIR
jgi:PIN domain nuclease of toxin-antitoxin system